MCYRTIRRLFGKLAITKLEEEMEVGDEPAGFISVKSLFVTQANTIRASTNLCAESITWLQ